MALQEGESEEGARWRCRGAKVDLTMMKTKTEGERFDSKSRWICMDDVATMLDEPQTSFSTTNERYLNQIMLMNAL